MPVAVSARFAERARRATRRRRSTITVGTTPVPIIVAEVAAGRPVRPGRRRRPGRPRRPLPRPRRQRRPRRSRSTPGGSATPPADAAERAAALRLGTVTTRAAETARLTGGPLRAGLPAALRLLVPAAALLLLAGVVLHVTCDLQVRALEVARLRGLGMTRREIRAVLLGQHAGVLLPLLAAGAAVGALATRLVAPLLVRSDTGAAPVPAALPSGRGPPRRPCSPLLLAGCALAVAAVVAVQARRADAAHLRVAS